MDSTLTNDNLDDANPKKKEIIKAVRTIKKGMWVAEDAIGRRVISVKNFFSDDKGEGSYTTKADFLKLLYSLQPGQIVPMEIAMQRMLEGKELDKFQNWNIDEKNRDFIDIYFNEDGIEHKLTVYLTGDMYMFFRLYYCHILVSNVSLEELYNEALKPNTAN